jgi:hypothetical protein
MTDNSNSMEVLVVTMVLGLCVLVSYFYIFAVKLYANYFTHPFWMGIPKSVVRILLPLQGLAALGFLVAIGSWIKNHPNGGVMGRNPVALPLTIGVFLATATVWPVAVYHKVHWLTVASLVGTAAASIAMLAGSIEEKDPRWWIVLGLVALSSVTVLGDGVLWNAKYVSALMYDPKFFEQW